jgi:hypothetical protein
LQDIAIARANGNGSQTLDVADLSELWRGEGILFMANNHHHRNGIKNQ